MYFLKSHLVDGSFRTVYCDTDSMAIALSKSKFVETDDLEMFYKGLFDGIIKENMRESWDAQWRSWFVYSRDPEIEKKPGLMKRKSRNNISPYGTI